MDRVFANFLKINKLQLMITNRYNSKTLHIVADLDLPEACRLADRIAKHTPCEPIEIRYNYATMQATIIVRCAKEQQAELELYLLTK